MTRLLLQFYFRFFNVFILIKGFDDNISADANVLEAAAAEELISDGTQRAYMMMWAGNSQNTSSAASAMLLKNPWAENSQLSVVWVHHTREEGITKTKKKTSLN